MGGPGTPPPFVRAGHIQQVLAPACTAADLDLSTRPYQSPLAARAAHLGARVRSASPTAAAADEEPDGIFLAAVRQRLLVPASELLATVSAPASSTQNGHGIVSA